MSALAAPARPPLTPQRTNTSPVGFVVHQDGVKPRKSSSGMLKPGFADKCPAEPAAAAGGAATETVEAVLLATFGDVLEIPEWKDFKASKEIKGVGAARRDTDKHVTLSRPSLALAAPGARRAAPLTLPRLSPLAPQAKG